MTDSPPTVSIDARLAERAAPSKPVVMYQRWEELLFLHWPILPELVAKDLPPGLRVDTFDDQAWMGVVPFSMRKVRPRFLPALPGLSDFPELNLRTYVVDSQGRPGVWFYSLDTPKQLPNWIARTFFHLNYRRARMQLAEVGERRMYHSELRTESGWDALQRYEWARTGAPCFAEPGSLDFFLVERYRLFAYDTFRKRLLTGKVHHEPYSIQSARVSNYSRRLFSTNGLPCPEDAPSSALASKGVDVRIYPMEVV